MAEVALPDGTVIPVPDAVLGIMPPPAKAEPPSVAEDIGQRALPRMLLRGIFSLPDLGVSAMKGMGSLKPTYDIPQAGTGELSAEDTLPAQAVREYMSRVKTPSESLIEATGVKKPETGPGKYAEEIGSGAIGALSFPGLIVPKVIAGAGGGAGGELAANMLEDKPWARIVGALAGSAVSYPALSAVKLATSFLGGPSVNTPKIVSDAARGTTPAEFDAMAAGQKAGRDLGVPTTPIQNLERPSALHGLQEKVTSASPELQSELAKQNPAAAKAGLFFLDKIAPPGEPSAVASRAQGAAEGAIEKGRTFATAATKPYYEITRPTVPTNELLLPALRAQQNAAQSPAAREFLKSQVFDKMSGETVQSVEELKNIINEAKTALKAPNIGDKGIDRHVMGKISTSLDELEKVVSSASANRPLGHQIYQEIYDSIVNPMRQSLTGKIAGVKGVVDEAVPPTTRILNELNAPTVRAESIHKLATDMARGGDPQAFPALVRATWEQNLEKAFGGVGGAAPNAPAKFASALWGTPEQAAKRENFRAAVAETARANGLKPREIDEAVVGAEKFAKVMEAAGRAKGGLGGAPGTGGGPVENIVLRGGPGIQPAAQFRFFGQISDWLNQKAYGEIAKALTSPEGMQELRKWASFDLAKYRMSAVSGATAGVGQQGQER